MKFTRPLYKYALFLSFLPPPPSPSRPPPPHPALPPPRPPLPYRFISSSSSCFFSEPELQKSHTPFDSDRALLDSKMGKEKAMETFKAYRSSYHNICSTMIAKDFAIL